MMHNCILLMGIKNSGKSSLGRRLASRTGASFIDLDDIIEDIFSEEYASNPRVKQRCREIYRNQGKDFFHDLELQAVLRISEICLQVNNDSADTPDALGTVVALGGGIADNNLAMKELQNLGLKIFLENEAGTLFSRIQRQGLPPFLEGKDPYGKFLSLFDRRTKVYRNYADIILNLSGRDLNNSLEALINSIKESPKEHGHAG